MNKYLSYILVLLLAAALTLLFITSSNKSNRRLDERITLRKQDKIPYGTYVAWKHLKYLFPDAAIYSNRHEPGYWDSLYNYHSGQAFIVVAGRLNASEYEMKRMITFVENGNDVFISARTLSEDAENMLGCKTSAINTTIFFTDEGAVKDSLSVTLSSPPYKKTVTYTYPGSGYSGWFYNIDSATTEILGYDKMGHPNFIHLKAGKGNFYVQLVPLAFSNYFLLHKNNIGYYEKALSVISPNTNRVVWDEYYLHKRNYRERPQTRQNWLNVLFRYPALKAALLTAIFTLLIFVLLEMRRKQRYIPVVTKPENDSIDFVRTIGRLYYDKGDHKNLCRKMGAYFLEHVRNKYKLPTGVLDDEFVKNLRFKSGCEESEIRGIVSFIKYVDDAPVIGHKELIQFHKDLESFYKKT